MQINPADLQNSERYKLLIGSILPRPIAFVSTIGTDGTNAAPFSFFTCVSTDPPMIGFTAMPGPFGPKDTLRHIRENGNFVVNIVSRSLLEKVNIAAADAPPGTSEFELAGLTEAPSVFIASPRVAEAKVHFECRLHQILELGRGPDHFIIGEVLLFHVADDVIDDRYRVDADQLDPVGRMAGNLYATCEKRMSLKRPKYSDLRGE